MPDRIDGTDVEQTGNSYRARYDFETTVPSTAVIDLLRTVTHEEGSDVGPLYDAVDPDALDGILGDGWARDRFARREVTFSYRGYAVTVRDDGVVTVRPLADEDRSGD